MKATQIGERGWVFAFEDPYLTNVLVIIGDKRVFVCDTFCGPDSMKTVVDYLQQQGHGSLPMVVFNSHSHYDHIWGNSFFEGAPIISQRESTRLIDVEGPQALLDYAAHKKGDVRLVKPNTTFEKRISFIEEGVEFFHSPGHTIDSASCYDSRDKVLFVSDNVESTMPYLYQSNLLLYIETMKGYLHRDWNFLVTGHDPVSQDNDLVRSNLDYLLKVKDWTLKIEDLPVKARIHHFNNIATISEEMEERDRSKEMVSHFQSAIDYLSSQDETAQTKELQKRLQSIISS
ncbi:MAG: MBL fold metallo-hydrolase [Candidatus Thorarchaeota archaeon]|jgi:glyoxylase-like metal-dependent hydrolase (beta-lactamase superfamily II)